MIFAASDPPHHCRGFTTDYPMILSRTQSTAHVSSTRSKNTFPIRVYKPGPYLPFQDDHMGQPPIHRNSRTSRKDDNCRGSK
eukprot:g67177.t1